MRPVYLIGIILNILAKKNLFFLPSLVNAGIVNVFDFIISIYPPKTRNEM